MAITKIHREHLITVSMHACDGNRWDASFSITRNGRHCWSSPTEYPEQGMYDVVERGALAMATEIIDLELDFPGAVG